MWILHPTRLSVWCILENVLEFSHRRASGRNSHTIWGRNMYVEGNRRRVDWEVVTHVVTCHPVAQYTEVVHCAWPIQLFVIVHQTPALAQISGAKLLLWQCDQPGPGFQ